MAKQHTAQIGKKFDGGRRELLINGKVRGYINPDLDYVNGGWKQSRFVAEVDLGTEGTERWVAARFEDEANPVSIKDAIASLLSEINDDINDDVVLYRIFKS